MSPSSDLTPQFSQLPKLQDKQEKQENFGDGEHCEQEIGSIPRKDSGHDEPSNQFEEFEQAERFVSRSLNWHERVGMMSVGMSKAICTDSQMSFLDMESLGLLIRIHALNRTNRQVPVDLDIAGRILGVKTKKLGRMLKALMAAAPELLVVDSGFLTVPSLGCDPSLVRKSAQIRYRDLTQKRLRESSAEIERMSKSNPLLLPAIGSMEPVKQNGTDKNDSMAVKGSKKSKVSTKKTISEIPSCPYQALSISFNEICTSLSSVNESSSWTPARKSTMNNRWKERPEVSFWAGVFADVQRSDFLTGRQSHNPWRCGFDWIIKPANLQKILEGNFANRGGVRRALWDQGDKTRNADMLADMQSEVDDSAPFLRIKPQENNSDISPKDQSVPVMSDASKIAIDDLSPIQRTASFIAPKMPHRIVGPVGPGGVNSVGGVGGVGGAGQAPAGFGLKQVRRVAQTLNRSTSSPREQATPVDPTFIAPIAEPLIASGAAVKKLSAAGPSSSFTPDRLRNSIRSHTPPATAVVPMAAGIPEVPAEIFSHASKPTLTLTVEASQSPKNPENPEKSPEKQTFRFRNTEQKGG